MPQRSLVEIREEQTQLRARVGHLVDEAREIDIKLEHDGANDGLEERKANVERGKAKASSRLAELGAEYTAAVTRRIESGQTYQERGDGCIDPAETSRTDDGIEPHRRAALDGAMRTLERCQKLGTMESRAAVAMEHAVRYDDSTGVTARYLAAAGDPAYKRAFGKLLQYADTAAMRMTSEEQAAVQRVTAVESERAMMDISGAAGGFALPIEIDPSVLLSSSGALNPIRSIAKVRQMTGYTLRLVSALTPASGYVPEGVEMSDASPTLVQPTITAFKGATFIPFSIEIGQDWAGASEDLGRLLADGRDILDATKFLSGNGTTEPQGLYTGLTTTQRVQTATTATTVIGDLYALKEQLNSTRFWTNATYAANPTVWDVFFRFVGSGNTTEPMPFGQGRGGPFLGTPKVEWSTMSTGTTSTGQQIAFAGDFSNYVIGDRIGSQIELIPHLFGAANRYPTGQRGLYYYWRTGASVAVPNGFRYLEVK